VALPQSFHPDPAYFMHASLNFVITSPELMLLRNKIFEYLQPAVGLEKKYVA
jgi:hypothetical protein